MKVTKVIDIYERLNYKRRITLIHQNHLKILYLCIPKASSSSMRSSLEKKSFKIRAFLWKDISILQCNTSECTAIMLIRDLIERAYSAYSISLIQTKGRDDFCGRKEELVDTPSLPINKSLHEWKDYFRKNRIMCWGNT